jgi:hypothetical protein
MKDKSCISINLPSLEELIKREPRVCLNIRMGNDSAPPFSREAIECAKGYAGEKGVYVHLWKKRAGVFVVRYVGQTSKSFRKRLNWELSLQHKACSKEFIEGMKKHVNQKDIYTVFFSDEDIVKMITASKKIEKQKDSLRLLFEQAMVIAYKSKDLLNVHKG